jgi:hypothetical protein
MSAIEIVNHVPMPSGRRATHGVLAELRGALESMKAGDSFVWPDNKLIFRVAKECGVVITTRKTGASGYRIWRRK